MNKNRLRLLLIIIVVIAVSGIVFSFRKKRRADSVSPLTVVYTIAGSPQSPNGVRFIDPFGIAVGKDGDVYVTDGETGMLWQLKPDGSARVISGGLDTPSGIGVAPDGSLVIAETGAHVIRRVYSPDWRSEVVAGAVGLAGFSDGNHVDARFNGPTGIAVSDDGTIYVADTYNDRVRAIGKDGIVRTIAGGGEVGLVDAQTGTDARFNTPCGIALSPDGTLVVADTGNHRIRGVDKTGSVRTITGTGRAASDDGFLFTAEFNEPIGVAVDKDGTIFVADSGSSALRSCGWNIFPRVWTLAGEDGAGFQDGPIQSAQMSHPTGIALAPDGTLVFTDNGNRVVRAIGVSPGVKGLTLDSNALSSLWPTASEIRASAPGRWPYDPPDRPREIAATFGEIRGEVTESNKRAWFHNGLDIPGAYGESVRAVRAERILNPLSVKDVGTFRERIRFPTIGYIHVRIGRDSMGKVLDDAKFLVHRDSDGQITNLRVRRGTKFLEGDAIGTLNNQNHVHLTVGPIGREFNAIAALELPGIKDTVAPTIDDDGVRLFDSSWRELQSEGKDARLEISGDVRIVVRAYDQMDGNAARRRLGIYRLGYQMFASDGIAPAPGFAEPHVTILFESLPRDEGSAQLAYASGSHSGATGETIFAYIVTNIVHGTDTRDSYFSASLLPPGDYTLQVFAEDFFGNRVTRDRKVRCIALSK